MERCDSCADTILFGGVHEAGYRFCGKKCRDRHAPLAAALAVDDARVAGVARMIGAGACPGCGQRGGLEVYRIPWMWSFLLLTRCGLKTFVGCRRCATKQALKMLVFSGLLGWWGIPLGPLLTPFVAGQNLATLLRRSSEEDSPALAGWVRRRLAERGSAGNPEDDDVSMTFFELGFV